MNQENAIVVGSLSDIAQQQHTSIAETFLSADAVVIVDVSASMDSRDARGNRTRYELAIDELASLQASLPGKVAVIAFSTTVMFVPGGQPPFLQGSTDLAEALRFAKVADLPEVRFVIISDGEPDSREDALAVARGYKARIDTIYVGPEVYPLGRDFLSELACVSGGQTATADRVSDLALTTERLLIGDAEYNRKFAPPTMRGRGPNPMYK